ncbi:hypothetical protein BY458DRAFT_536143 [Sporodiniella umbellata]|nr:hypothetical protein BY458DRAFT_536143 [Sporodiniella umbellata]
MGAQVKDTMDKKTTHVVHGPKKGNIIPKTIKQAAANNIFRVSPKWIIQCYKQQVRLGITSFPYDLDENTGMGLAQISDESDDPFGIKNRIPDIVERPIEQQLRIERFFTRQDTAPENEIQEHINNKNDEENDDEIKRVACELRSKQIEEAIKAKREEIAMNQSKGPSESLREGSSKIQLQKRKKPTFGVNTEFFEHDGMKIWYGEQSYRL